jgi:hypothetical protein
LESKSWLLMTPALLASPVNKIKENWSYIRHDIFIVNFVKEFTSELILCIRSNSYLENKKGILKVTENQNFTYTHQIIESNICIIKLLLRRIRKIFVFIYTRTYNDEQIHNTVSMWIKGKNPLEDLGVGGRIMLEWIWEKLDRKIWTRFFCLLWTRYLNVGSYKSQGISWLAEWLLAPQENFVPWR